MKWERRPKPFGGSQTLFPVEGIVRTAAEGGYPVALSVGDGFGAQAYTIRFAPGAASLAAGTRTGLCPRARSSWGRFLSRGAKRRPETFRFRPEGEIPGTHLDVARQFYGSAEIARFLRIVAGKESNRFHWHLSDDEAWRVEIEAYPEWAWRAHGRPIPALLGSGAEAATTPRRRSARSWRSPGATPSRSFRNPRCARPLLCHASSDPEPARSGRARPLFPRANFSEQLPQSGAGGAYSGLWKLYRRADRAFPVQDHPHRSRRGAAWRVVRLAAVARHAARSPRAAAGHAHGKRLNVLTSTHGADEIGGSGAALLQAEFCGAYRRS